MSGIVNLTSEQERWWKRFWKGNNSI